MDIIYTRIEIVNVFNFSIQNIIHNVLMYSHDCL